MSKNGKVQFEDPMKKGRKTKVFEASGLSGIVEALPGVSEKIGDGSYEVQEDFSGDAFVSGVGDGLSSHLALQLKNPFLQAFAYNMTMYLMLEVSHLLFDG